MTTNFDPLMLATLENNPEKALSILEGDAPFHLVKSLNIACKNGFLSIIKILIEYKENLNLVLNKETSYSYPSLILTTDKTNYLQESACFLIAYGHLECLEYFIEKGLILEPSFLNHAFEKGQLSIVKFLLDIHPEYFNSSCFESSYFSSDISTLKFFIEHNNYEIEKSNYDKAIEWNISKNKPEFISYLIEHYPNENKESSFDDFLFHAVNHGHFFAVKALVENNVLEYCHDNFFLYLSATLSESDIFQYLISLDLSFDPSQCPPGLYIHPTNKEWYEQYFNSKELNNKLQEILPASSSTVKRIKI